MDELETEKDEKLMLQGNCSGKPIALD